MKILIIKRDKLGDMLLTTPMLRRLRHHYPDAQIDVLANTYNAWVLDGNTDINKVISYQKVREGRTVHWQAALSQLVQTLSLRSNHYDWVIAANGEYSHRALKRARWIKGKNLVSYYEDKTPPSWLTHPLAVPHDRHETQRISHLLTALGISSPDDQGELRFTLPQDAAHFAQAWLSEHQLTQGGYISLGIGARRAKRKPSTEQIKRWTQYFFERWGLHTVFMWTPGQSDNPLYPGDDEIAQPIIEANLPWLHPFKGNLKQVLGLIWHARTSLFPDSGLMHFAAASPGGVLGFFADIEASPPPSQWSPVGPRARWLAAKKTLADLTDQQVFAAIEELLTNT